jgi:hypothetical protein
LLRAVYIPKEPPKKNSGYSGHICGVATIFCVYKGFSKKYKGKYGDGIFLLSFLTGKSD